MPISRRKFIKTSTGVFLIVISLWAISCSSLNGNTNVNIVNADQNSATSGMNAVRDDAEELGNVVRLPEMPDEAVWREEEIAAPKGKKLTAVLKYSPEAAARIIAAADKSKSPESSEIGSESWFPAELTAQSQLSGNESIKTTSYAADSFYNGAYLHGKISRVNETNYFVLELTTY